MSSVIVITCDNQSAAAQARSASKDLVNRRPIKLNDAMCIQIASFYGLQVWFHCAIICLSASSSAPSTDGPWIKPAKGQPVDRVPLFLVLLVSTHRKESPV